MSVSLDVHRLGRLRWIVLNGPGREAVIAVRDDQPIAIPLGDLAEGNPLRAAVSALPARTCRDDAHDRIRADIGLILASWAWIPHRNYPILTQPDVPGTASVDFGQ